MKYSGFNYGHTITRENKYFPIDEGDGEIIVELRVRSYTLGEFVIELNRALNAFGELDYQVTLNRSTGQITIAASDDFSILLESSTLKVNSCYELVGFTDTVDLIGEDEYTGNIRSGFLFLPQFPLQSYIDFENSQRAANATVNESASGKVEVVKFGNVKIMTCNITLQTNNTQVSACNNQSPIRPDSNGVNNLRNFMLYAITKAPMEFIFDIENNDDVNTPRRCILESTQQDSNGTGFELIELYSRGLVGYFETGIITFRELK
jgi:hypothetical protein